MEGEGESQGNPTGEKDAIFSWQEVVQCFWATSVFLGRRMTIVGFDIEKKVSLKA